MIERLNLKKPSGCFSRQHDRLLWPALNVGVQFERILSRFVHFHSTNKYGFRDHDKCLASCSTIDLQDENGLQHVCAEFSLLSRRRTRASSFEINHDEWMRKNIWWTVESSFLVVTNHKILVHAVSTTTKRCMRNSWKFPNKWPSPFLSLTLANPLHSHSRSKIPIHRIACICRSSDSSNQSVCLPLFILVSSFFYSFLRWTLVVHSTIFYIVTNSFSSSESHTVISWRKYCISRQAIVGVMRICVTSI